MSSEESLFFQALEDARKTHKEYDRVQRYPIQTSGIPEFLAKVILCTPFEYDKIKIGLDALDTFSKIASMQDLKIYLPVFADFFGYIY